MTGGSLVGQIGALPTNRQKQQMNFAAISEDAQSVKSYNQSFISSTGATTKSTSGNENGNVRNLMGQLVRRILVASKVSPSEWPMKESLLLSMSESILSR